MKWVFSLAVTALALAVSLDAAPPKRDTATVKRPPAHKTAHVVPASRTSVHTAASVHSTSTRVRTAKRTRRAYVAPAPSYQLQPDPDRYQQIQQALADRGYFKGEVNGQWGDDSVDALQRFQADQKLPNDGKISALTLIDLGLGPKRDSALISAIPAQPASPAAQPAPQ